MKKKKIIVLAIAITLMAVIAVACIVFFKEVPIISSPYIIGDASGYLESEIIVSRVRFNGIDVTSGVDIEGLLGTLSNYNCKRSSRNPFPYPSADMVWEIDIVQKFKPIHIVLGKDSVRYEDSSDIFMYRILDPESLMNELNSTVFSY